VLDFAEIEDMPVPTCRTFMAYRKENNL